MRNILAKRNLATLIDFASSNVVLGLDYDPWEPSRESAEQVNEWVTNLRRQLARYPELVIEDKKYSVTIHHGAVRDTARVRQAIAAAVDALPNVRALAGPRAINLLPRAGPHKGDALQSARIALACKAAIYIGDDETDEDAFTSADSNQLLAIRIGHFPHLRRPLLPQGSGGHRRAPLAAACGASTTVEHGRTNVERVVSGSGAPRVRTGCSPAGAPLFHLLTQAVSNVAIL